MPRLRYRGARTGETGEAFLALLQVPYRTNHGDISSTCVISNRRMKEARGALVARAVVGMWPQW